MDEVGGALVGIAAVLVAVFVPTAFMGGIAGQFYKQFRAHDRERDDDFARRVAEPDAGVVRADPQTALRHREPELDRQARRADGAGGSTGSASATVCSHAETIRASAVMLVLYGGLLALAGWRILDTPRGFIPPQDNGTLFDVRAVARRGDPRPHGTRLPSRRSKSSSRRPEWGRRRPTLALTATASISSRARRSSGQFSIPWDERL